MYGGEKSDQAIVAIKLANIGGGSVERRARAEGNAIQRYTRVGRSAGVGVPIVGLHAGRRSAITQGGSRMRESRTYGSVRGALSNERPYRDAIKPPLHLLHLLTAANGTQRTPTAHSITS